MDSIANMPLNTTPYPSCRTYAWERIGSLPQPVKFWQDITLKTKRSSKNPRAVVACNKLLARLEDLASGDDAKTAHTPAEYKAMLIEAAAQAMWYQAPSGRKGFTATVEGRPDLRRCSGCNKEKPVGDFNAEASPKRKAQYNWGRDGRPTADRRLYVHALCTNCRGERKRRPRAKKGTPQGSALRKKMEVVAKLSQNFIKRIEDNYDTTAEDWVCTDGRYYFHKMRLAAVVKARDALDKLEINKDKVPERWQLLLPEDLRHRIFERFQEQVLPMWSGKGKEPKCF